MPWRVSVQRLAASTVIVKLVEAEPPLPALSVAVRVIEGPSGSG